jgi:hypothetical protein
MTRAQLARVERLQALAAPSGGVVRYADGETPAAAAERAVAAGRRGPFIAVPVVPSAADWERETIAQQVELQRRATVFMTTGCDPGAS